MTKILNLAKFVENRGLAIVLGLALFMALLAGLIFYFYAWRAINEATDSTAALTSIRQTLLETVIKDLDNRAEKTNKLKDSPLNISNIFR